jgi:hypothetical protein
MTTNNDGSSETQRHPHEATLGRNFLPRRERAIIEDEETEHVWAILSFDTFRHHYYYY